MARSVYVSALQPRAQLRLQDNSGATDARVLHALARLRCTPRSCASTC
jgi:hypothetical protein